MNTVNTLELAALQAHQLAENISNDIQYAQTRLEHMRLTQLHAEAERLALYLDAIDMAAQPV